MKFKIEFKCDNAAFRDADGNHAAESVGQEIDAILGRMRRVGTEGFGIVPGDSGKVLDSNGNTVGAWSLTK